MLSHVTMDGDAFPDASDERVYRMTWLRRGVALLGLVGVLLLLGFEIVEAGTLWSGGVLIDLAMVGCVVGSVVHHLGICVRVSDSAIRKSMPLWRDRRVHFEDVCGFHVPMVLADGAVRLYTDPDAAPALTLAGQAYERFDDLLRQVARRLPDAAEVRDPANRIAEKGTGAEGEDA